MGIVTTFFAASSHSCTVRETVFQRVVDVINGFVSSGTVVSETTDAVTRVIG